MRCHRDIEKALNRIRIELSRSVDVLKFGYRLMEADVEIFTPKFNVSVTLTSNVPVALTSNVSFVLTSNVSVALTSNVSVALTSNVSVALTSNVSFVLGVPVVVIKSA